MSLVAYGSSDDSEQSDSEESRKDDINDRNQKPDVQIGLIGNNLDDKFSDSESDTEASRTIGENEQDSLDHKLKELPTPKAADSGQIVETDELEELVKPKPSQVADVEKPLPRKPRQPVKITIPALPDSDDEDNEPAKKRPRPGLGNGKSGLTSILPAPMHAAKKEAGRILLPYSLTKKAQSGTSSATGPKKSSPNNGTSEKSQISHNLGTSLEDYGSDSDDGDESMEPVSFFSLDSSATKTGSVMKSSDQNSTLKSSHQNLTVGPSLPAEKNDDSPSKTETGIPTVPLPPTLGRTSLNLPAPAKSSNTDLKSERVSVPSSENLADMASKPIGPSVDPDAPLTFKGGVSTQRTFGGYHNSNNSVASSSSSFGTAEGDQNMYYNMPYESMQYPEPTDVEGFRQDDEFLRLQGKKQRGKEEINLIDVNADDFTDPSEITKHLTEEQTYQSHKKKDNQPTGQQKRKHQIHYLAFQAKERELELKNQWSQNRQTKKQTQAKYGF